MGISCTHRSVENPDSNGQEKNWPARFGFGKPATAEKIAALDIDVGPDGKGLPLGSGTVQGAKVVFVEMCHLSLKY